MTSFPADAILVVLETDSEGGLAKSAAELIGAAASVGSPVTLVTSGATTGAIDAAADAGAIVVVTAEIADPGALGVPIVDAVEAAVALVRPDAVLLSHSADGRDIAARFAVRSKLALSVDAVGISRDDLGVVAHHSVYGGAYNATSSATFGAPVITIRQGSIDERAGAQPVQAVPLEVASSGKPAAAVEGFTAEITESSRPELRGAAKVVAGGRGLGSKDQFVLVEQLADALGAAIGASRAAVDSGFIPQTHQVGQTGVTVSPQLYVALGISGAIQHRAGMQTAKSIIAINKDADAPIFGIADFGVVGDVFTVVPQLIAAIEAKRK